MLSSCIVGGIVAQNTKKRQQKQRWLKEKTRQLVVPNKKNQFRPHLVRRYGLLALVFAALLVQVGFTAISGTGVLGDRSVSITTPALLDATNAERRENGAGSLVMSERLSSAAAMKVDDMFTNQYWSHESPTGTKPWQWFKAAQYTYSVAGENLAKNFYSTEGTVHAWMNSPSHRQNMLDPRFKEAGFAVKSGELDGKPATIVVALYAAPAEPSTLGAIASASPVSLGLSGTQPSPMSQFGMALSNLTPAALASLVVMMGAAIVALAAHNYRRKLPKHLRKTWYRHHGLIKAALIIVAIIAMIWMYGGSQI